MRRQYFFWVSLAVILSIYFTFFSLWEEAKPIPLPEEQLSAYPIPPFQSYISGTGIVEASSDNISITTPINRIINKVFVSVGSKVHKGDVLFTLEDDDLKADLKLRQIAYEIALAKEQKLKSLPRPEDVSALQAALKNAQIELNQATNQYEMVQSLRDTRALSQQEINRRRYTYEQALAHWQEADANLNKVKAGTWGPDLAIAKLESEEVKTNLERLQADIQRTIIRSPIEGKVLQVRIHEGESPSLMSMQGPLMIIGNTDQMFLKVSINQFDAPYFRANAAAVAFLRGNAREEFPLEFIRLEPFLVNKQNLTNEITEKVDTRVLQVIYRIKNIDQYFFVGQQMDVFIEAELPS